MSEDERIIDPPEIREPEENLSQVEFYVDLGVPRPELEILRIITSYLAEKAPLVIMNISFSYQPGNEHQPDVLIANLIHGQPLDFG